MKKDDLTLISTLISDKTGILHTNRLRLRPYPKYIQVWLKSGVLGSASIRLQSDQIDDLITFLQNYRSKQQ